MDKPTTIVADPESDPDPYRMIILKAIDKNSRIRIRYQRYGSTNPDPDPNQNVGSETLRQTLAEFWGLM